MVRIPFHFRKLFILLITAGLIFIVYLGYVQYQKKGSVKGMSTDPLLGMKILQEKSLPEGKFVAIVDHEVFEGLGLVLLDEEHNFNQWLPEGEYLGPSEGDRFPGEYFDWWELADFNKDGKLELAIQLHYTGTGIVHPFYLYQYKNGSFGLLLKFIEGVSKAELVDLNNDGNKEIIYSFVLDSTGNLGRTLTPWKEVWIWQEGKYRLANDLSPGIYQDMIPKYEDLIVNTEQNNVARSYQKVLSCLKEKAQLNSQGKFADGKKCSHL